MIGRALVPLSAALLGLAGSLAATFALYRSAGDALDRVLEERLRGAGVTAAELLQGTPATADRLRAIMDANQLDGAYVVSPALEVLADATGPAGRRADLLRVDAARVAEALRGVPSMGRSYDVGPLSVDAAYFPVRDDAGSVKAVLGLEAGRSFAAARSGLRRALLIGVVLACAGAIALGVAAARWMRSERLQREAATRAARGDMLARMAATVAHEIRNPLGIIRAAVDLVRERAAGMGERDRARLQDVLGEVERLRRLTEDFLDLSADRPLAATDVALAEVAAQAARGNTVLHPDAAVRVDLATLPPVRGDPTRLRQVFANLLANAAEAGARHIEIAGEAANDHVAVTVRDDGRGVDPSLRDRLFDPFATRRDGGTGLGLAVSARIVERHGGTLRVADTGGAGTSFQLTLPRGG